MSSHSAAGPVRPVAARAYHVGYSDHTDLFRMKMLFRGWPVMVHDTHTRRTSGRQNNFRETSGYPSWHPNNSDRLKELTFSKIHSIIYSLVYWIPSMPLTDRVCSLSYLWECRWCCTASEMSQLYQQLTTWTQIQLKQNINRNPIRYINIYTIKKIWMIKHSRMTSDKRNSAPVIRRPNLTWVTQKT